jgi:hypothetical protein
MIPADGHAFVPEGYGILKIPAPNSQGYLPVFCYHTPGIQSTIVSPCSLKRLIPKGCFTGTTLEKPFATRHFTFVAHNNLCRSENIVNPAWQTHGTQASGTQTQNLMTQYPTVRFKPSNTNDNDNTKRYYRAH